MRLVVNELHDHAKHAEPGHPERPDRVGAVVAGVGDLHLGDDLVEVPRRAATRAELARVHDEPYLDDLAVYCYNGGGDLDTDTYATYGSWDAAVEAAGAGLAVVEELARRDDAVGFVYARPPGHHATARRAMGFCLLNNVAVAAAALVDRGERVLILDWDVHHGNGTQDIFWDEDRVLYASLHQWPLYPGSGSAAEVGGPDARGLTLNVPLAPGATGDVARAAVAEVVAPAAAEFAPTWVLVSSGFDAHLADPLADLAWSAGDYAALALDAAALAPSRSRVAVFLEGGYDLAALRSSTAGLLGALLDAAPPSEAPTAGGPGLDAVGAARAAREAALAQG